MKKLLSKLLIVSMLLNILPLQVLADNVDVSKVSEKITETVVKGYRSVEDKFKETDNTNDETIISNEENNLDIGMAQIRAKYNLSSEAGLELYQAIQLSENEEITEAEKSFLKDFILEQIIGIIERKEYDKYLNLRKLNKPNQKAKISKTVFNSYIRAIRASKDNGKVKTLSENDELRKMGVSESIIKKYPLEQFSKKEIEKIFNIKETYSLSDDELYALMQSVENNVKYIEEIEAEMRRFSEELDLYYKDKISILKVFFQECDLSIKSKLKAFNDGIAEMNRAAEKEMSENIEDMLTRISKTQAINSDTEIQHSGKDKVETITGFFQTEKNIFSNGNGKEEIGLNSGTVKQSQDIIQVKGQGNHSLNLGFKYDSSQSTVGEYGIKTNTNYTTKYYVKALRRKFDYYVGENKDENKEFEILGQNTFYSEKSKAEAKLEEYREEYDKENETTHIVFVEYYREEVEFLDGKRKIIKTLNNEGMSFDNKGAAQDLYNDLESCEEERDAAYKVDGKVVKKSIYTVIGKRLKEHRIEYEFAGRVEDVDIGESSTKNTVNKDTLFEKKFNIGTGWRWNISTIDTYNKVMYLSDGRTLSFEAGNDENCTIKEYDLKNINLKKYKNSKEINGTSNIVYTVEYSDGRKEHFDNAGKLLAQENKYGSKNSFSYSRNFDKELLSEIKDSAGRIIRLEYVQDNAKNYERTIKVYINDMLETTIRLEKISGDDYMLKEIVDSEDRRTTFEYEKKAHKFSLLNKALSKNNENVLLSRVTYNSGAKTEYSYEKHKANMGKRGIKESFRVSEKRTYSDGNLVNTIRYEYQNNNTAYGSASSMEDAPDDYRYSTTVVLKNKKKKHTFSKDHLKVLIEDYVDDKLKSETKTEYNGLDLPVKTTSRSFKMGSTTEFIKNTINYRYDSENHGNIVGMWEAANDRNSEGVPLNDNHKITMAYENSYNQLVLKEYYRDVNKKIKEENILTDDKKNTKIKKIYENDILKGKTEYEYDTYGNVIEERRYLKENGNWDTFSTMKYGYQDINTEDDMDMNGVFRTRTWVENLVDIDGNNKGDVGQSLVYDIKGNIIKTIDAEGNEATSKYDSIGRTMRLVNADGSYKSYSYNDRTNSILFVDEERNMVCAQYDSFGNMIKIIDVDSVEYFEKNDPKYVTEGEFKVRGKTIKESFYDGYLKLDREEVYVYNLESETDILKTITLYDYHTDDRMKSIKVKEVRGGNETVLSEETYSYHDAEELSGERFNKVVKTIKGRTEDKDITIKTYVDKLGQLKRQDRVHSGKDYTDTFNYDYKGNRTSEKTARAYDEGWGEGSTGTYEYDFADRLIKQSNIKGHESTTEYDSLGRVIAERDTGGNNSPEKYATTYEYDKMGRMIQKKIPFERKSGKIYYAVNKYYHDKIGNITKIETLKNKSGEAEDYNKSTFEYDKRSRIIRVTTFDENQPENYSQYYYDNIGNKLRMYTALSKPLTINGLDQVAGEDMEFSVTKYQYDGFSNLVKRIDPNGVEETYSYDSSGNLLKKIDREKQVISFDYDGYGRLKNRTTPDTHETYTYTLTGNRASMSNMDGLTTYSYDDLGRLEIETTGDIIKRYIYDAGSNRKRMIIEKKEAGQRKIQLTQTSYEYDNLNRLKEVKDQNDRKIVAYTYNANGNRESKQYSNGIRTDYSYNLVNNLTGMINRDINKNHIISSYDYTYHLNGNRASEQEKVLGLTDRYREFVYDGLNRLKNEKQNQEEEFIYTYDDNNNRKSKTVEGPEEPAYLEELLKNVKMVYNSNNQMIEADIEGLQIDYKYNADGQRTQKKVGDETTNHIWDGGQIALETDANDDIKAIYQRGMNLLTMDREGRRLFYIYNGHGDVVQLTGEKGEIVTTYQYDAFGNQLNPSENDSNPYRYSGEYYDKETGYYYLRARYYDPRVGRFTTEDTYWGKEDDPLSLNIYVYCTNNPIMYVDPSGHMAVDQYGDLLYGMAKAGLEELLESIPFYGAANFAISILKMGIAIMDGELTFEDAIKRVGEGFIAPFKHVFENAEYIFEGDPTDKEVQDYGYNLGQVLLTVKDALLGGIDIVVALDCFVEGTMVSTEEGLVPIEDIEVGDKVYTQDDMTGEKGLKKVTRLFRNTTKTLVHIKIDGEEITTTKTHPFYVEDKGWVVAGDLIVGFKVVKRDGSTVKIEEIREEEVEKEVTTYNFEVEEYHTYYVGENEMLVHNKCGKAVPKRPGGYVKNDVDMYENLSPNNNRATGNKNIKSDNRVQAHHPIQNEWAKRNVPDYNKRKAPAILLESSSGKEHANISAAQRRRRKIEGYDTDIIYEFNTSYREMIDAGVSEKSSRKAIRSAYKYFDEAGGFE